MSVEAMKQALEALEYADEMIDTACVPKAITNLRIAIEQAEKIEPVMGTKTWYEDGKVITQNLYPSDVYKQEKQEPVAWMYEVNGAHTILDLFEPPDDAYDEGTLYPLYTTPQPQQEPVKMVAYNCLCGRIMKFESVNGIVAPQREWVGLTDEEITALKRNGERYISSQEFARAIEAKLKEKNT